MIRIIFSVICLLCSNMLSAQSHQPDSRYCLVCHGTNAQGSEVIGGPNLVILPDWYLKDQLHAFQKQWRGHIKEDLYGQEMRMVAKWMTEQEIDNAITFIKTLTPIPATDNQLQGNVQNGKQLYQACAACHGVQGEGNAILHAPPLAGQTDWYLVKQLKAYKNNQRGTDNQDTYGMIMRQSVAILTSDSDIQDVVSYINTLKTQQ